MPYQATVIPIMIASPSDVLEEREIVREVIIEWNYINSSTVRVVLMPVGWDTHSSPELSARPQELINERVLKDCDLLIAVFWTRLGTPTGKASSGSAEEIERHIAAGKPVMAYFSTAPVAPQNLDQQQFNALSEFKNWCKDRGLVEHFESLVDFRQKFLRQLQIKLRDNPYLKKLFDESLKPAGDQQISPSTSFIPSSLSKEAIILLIEGAADKTGIIMSVRFMGGQSIHANGKKFGDSSDRRSMARWEHALDQLVSHGLVIPRGVKNEVFQVSDPGYRLAEELNSKRSPDERSDIRG